MRTVKHLGGQAPTQLSHSASQNAVDSPFTVDGEEIKPNTEVCRSTSISPTDISDPSIEFKDNSNHNGTVNWMQVKGTYLDGNFVNKQVKKYKNAYPSEDKIIKKERYVKIVDLRTGFTIYITEERFTELFNSILFTSN